jgi:large subunit ribosomal protein L19
MNPTIVNKIEQAQMKKVPDLRAGDVVRVHQKIKEGNKERIQIFEGVVLKVTGSGLKETFLVRKMSFGIGVEKSYLLHSPNIAKVEIKKRSKVRKGYLTYLRALTGKSARLKDKQFDMLAANVIDEPVVEEAKETEKVSDEKLDAEITELSEEQIAEAEAEEVPLSEVVDAENKEADKEDKAGNDKAENDHQVAEIEEIKEGLNKAEADNTGQATEGETAEKVAEDTTEEEIKEEVKQEKEDEA